MHDNKDKRAEIELTGRIVTLEQCNGRLNAFAKSLEAQLETKRQLIKGLLLESIATQARIDELESLVQYNSDMAKAERLGYEKAEARVKELEAELKRIAKNVAKGTADAYKARVKELEAQLEREQLPWTVELCYNDGNNPFERLTLKIADVGVSDRVLVVTHPSVDEAFKHFTTEVSK